MGVFQLGGPGGASFSSYLVVSRKATHTGCVAARTARTKTEELLGIYQEKINPNRKKVTLFVMCPSQV